MMFILKILVVLVSAIGEDDVSWQMEAVLSSKDGKDFERTVKKQEEQIEKKNVCRAQIQEGQVPVLCYELAKTGYFLEKEDALNDLCVSAVRRERDLEALRILLGDGYHIGGICREALNRRVHRLEYRSPKVSLLSELKRRGGTSLEKQRSHEQTQNLSR